MFVESDDVESGVESVCGVGEAVGEISGASFVFGVAILGEFKTRGVGTGEMFVRGASGVGKSLGVSGVDAGGTITTGGKLGVGVAREIAFCDVPFDGGTARRNAVEMSTTAKAPPTIAKPTIALIGILLGKMPVLGAVVSSFKTTWRGRTGAPLTVDGPDGNADPVLDDALCDCDGKGGDGKGCV